MGICHQVRRIRWRVPSTLSQESNIFSATSCKVFAAIAIQGIILWYVFILIGDQCDHNFGLPLPIERFWYILFRYFRIIILKCGGAQLYMNYILWPKWRGIFLNNKAYRFEKVPGRNCRQGVIVYKLNNHRFCRPKVQERGGQFWLPYRQMKRSSILLLKHPLRFPI